MSVIVQKFGGTSVATPEKITAAARRAVATKHAGHQVVMVVSARGHKTDELVQLAEDVTDNPSPREMDMLLSTGEQESVALVAMAIHKLGEKAISMTGGQIGIFTDSTYSKARIQRISTDNLCKFLDDGYIVVACGFQGVDAAGHITTLGRGGSDTTATALAAVLQAETCEIYTDVDGVYTTDPRQVTDARKIERISYDEMLELASLGAGVMHSRSIEFAKKFRVHLRVRPAYSDSPGTLIAPDSGEPDRVVTGLALVKQEARVSLVDIPDRPGVMSHIFGHLSARKIPVDMVVQDIGSAGLAEVSFTVPEGDLAQTLTAADEALKHLGSGKVQHGTNLAKVSAVGNGMQIHSGVAAQMFSALAASGINIEMIATSEIKISCLVNRDRWKDALLAVHTGFKLEAPTASPPPMGWQQKRSGKDEQLSRENLEHSVVSRLGGMEDIVVSEVQLDDTQSLISVRNIPDKPGVCAHLFSAVAEGDVMVDMIVQNVSSGGHSHVSFTVHRDHLDRALLLVREVASQWPGAQVQTDRDIAKISVMGIGLRSHTGVGQRMFQSLAENNINIRLIGTSEIRMSVLVTKADGKKAHAGLVKTFGLG